MTPQQIQQFKSQAKAMGKSDIQIDAFIKAKQSEVFSPKQPETPFTLKPQVTAPTKPLSTGGKIWQGVKQGLGQAFQSAIGVGKGMLSTVEHSGELGQKALSQTAGRTANLLTGKGFKPTEVGTIVPEKAITPTEAQKPAFVGEQIGEFLIPGAAETKAGKTLNTLIEGLKLSRPAAASLRVGGKAGISALSAGGVGLSQTASGKEATKAAGTAGLITGVTNAAGETLRAARIPEWFQSKVFKNSKADMLDELKTIGDQNIEKTDPELFKQLTEAGIIKRGENGKVILNETLAKESLDRGLKGSIKNMANEVVKTARKSEMEARSLVATHDVPIKIESHYQRLLVEVADDYKDVGFGEISQKAEDLLSKIDDGKTDATTALELRRFLDGMRHKASFSPATKLTQTQQNFKSLADKMRERLAKEIPGMKDVMDNYRFSIEALDALAKEGNRRGNREAFSLLDGLFFSGGMASGNPVLGAGLGVGRRILNSPAGTTNIAKGIENFGKFASKKGQLLRGAASYKASKGSQPTQDN